MPSTPQESVIRRMTRLSLEHNAVNLSQGITDEPVLYDLAWAGIAAILGGSDEGAEHLHALTLRDLLSRNQGNDNHSLKDLCAILQPKHDRYNQYSFPYGLPELREAIADYTQRFYAFRPNPETQITVTAGATEGLSSTLRALCNPGDSVIVLQPFHEMYPNQASLFGLHCAYVTLRENRDGWAIDKDEWTTAAKRARALILNTPHNPTGKVFSETELAFIADLCCKRDLFLITDEIYEHILYGDCVHICPATLAGMAERTFVVNAITTKPPTPAVGASAGLYRPNNTPHGFAQFTTPSSYKPPLHCKKAPSTCCGCPTPSSKIFTNHFCKNATCSSTRSNPPVSKSPHPTAPTTSLPTTAPSPPYATWTQPMQPCT